MSQDVVIIDYGLGNLFNVQRAFEAVGTKTLISGKAEDLARADKAVLPGVGAFEPGMKQLRQNGLSEAIQDFAKRGKPLLGICLGMQLLLDESEENGRWEGLHLVPGRVTRFKNPATPGEFKIPQICWNRLDRRAGGRSWEGSLLAGLSEGEQVYFVNSYFVTPQNPAHTLAVTSYGHDQFTSVLQKDNVVACQFHPERSGEVGLKILSNFSKM